MDVEIELDHPVSESDRTKQHQRGNQPIAGPHTFPKIGEPAKIRETPTSDPLWKDCQSAKFLCRGTAGSMQAGTETLNPQAGFTQRCVIRREADAEMARRQKGRPRHNGNTFFGQQRRHEIRIRID